MMMIIYMQLNTHATAWAQAATWLTFLSVSSSLDFIGVGADVDADDDCLGRKDSRRWCRRRGRSHLKECLASYARHNYPSLTCSTAHHGTTQ